MRPVRGVAPEHAGKAFAILDGARLVIEHVLISMPCDVAFDFGAQIFAAEKHALLLWVGFGRLEPAELDAGPLAARVAEVAMRERQPVIDDGEDRDALPGFCVLLLRFDALAQC